MPMVGRRRECRAALVPTLRRDHAIHSWVLLTWDDVRRDDGLMKKTPRSAPVTCQYSLLLASTQWMGCAHRVRMVSGEHRAATDAHGIGDLHQVTAGGELISGRCPWRWAGTLPAPPVAPWGRKIRAHDPRRKVPDDARTGVKRMWSNSKRPPDSREEDAGLSAAQLRHVEL